jgi:hypothetical protein
MPPFHLILSILLYTPHGHECAKQLPFCSDKLDRHTQLKLQLIFGVTLIYRYLNQT